MIAVVDYKMGNVGSVINMMRKLRIEAILTRNVKDLKQSLGIILPGVGSFDHGVNQLRKYDLINSLTDLVMENKKPCLGICLGMQLMAKSSEEGLLPGLGWVESTVHKFRPDPDRPKLRIPHMGWNYVRPVDPKHTVFEGLPAPSRFYFVHSYHYPADMKNAIAVTNHTATFTSGFAKDNILGFQFHPEKSHSFGLLLLSNFKIFCEHAR